MFGQISAGRGELRGRTGTVHDSMVRLLEAPVQTERQPNEVPEGQKDQIDETLRDQIDAEA